jgi:hypothetical protein
MALRVGWVYRFELKELACAKIDHREIKVPRECPGVRIREYRRQSNDVSKAEVVSAVRRMRVAAPLVRPTIGLVAKELSIACWHPIFDQREVRDYLASSSQRVGRIRATLKVWGICNAVRSAATEILSQQRKLTQRNIRELLPKWGFKSGTSRARFVRCLLARILEKIGENDYSMLELRPAPKLIKGLVEFGE